MPDRLDVTPILATLAGSLETALSQRGIDDPLLVGVHTGGVWVAEALREQLQLKQPIGTLSITFYRDDFTRIGLHPQVKPSQLPPSVDDRHIVLVDDVLHTGRTVRAALNEIFDYGRPASVLLAVLVDRGGRELPFEPTVVGTRLELERGQNIKLTGPKPLTLQLQEEP